MMERHLMFGGELAKNSSVEEWPEQILHQGLDIEGTFVCEKALFFDGKLEGKMIHKTLLIIGPHARIKGQVMGKQVVVHGVVEGDIVGEERVHLTSQAFVTGSVVGKYVQMDFGAVVQGRVTSSKECSSVLPAS